jgi:PilZ domain
MNRFVDACSRLAGRSDNVKQFARSMMTVLSDRRGGLRLTVRPPVAVIVTIEERFPHSAQLKDLSPRGARLLALSPLQKDVSGVLEHPASGIWKPCTIRFCTKAPEGFDIGLQFKTHLSSADLRSIGSILLGGSRALEIR